MNGQNTKTTGKKNENGEEFPDLGSGSIHESSVSRTLHVATRALDPLGVDAHEAVAHAVELLHDLVLDAVGRRGVAGGEGAQDAALHSGVVLALHHGGTGHGRYGCQQQYALDHYLSQLVPGAMLKCESWCKHKPRVLKLSRN